MHAYNCTAIQFCFTYTYIIEREDITRLPDNMDFMLEWQEQYLYN